MKKCMLMFFLLLLSIIVATLYEKKDNKMIGHGLVDKEVALENTILGQNEAITGNERQSEAEE